MSFWSRFSGNKPKNEQKRLDYLSEGLALERQGDFEAALTYQLALRDQPTNHRVLQNMAIAYSRTGRQTEAIRCYRRALEIQPKLSGYRFESNRLYTSTLVRTGTWRCTHVPGGTGSPQTEADQLFQ